MAAAHPSLKDPLLSLRCPLVKETEQEEQVQRLLIQQSDHRKEILSWVVKEIEEAMEVGEPTEGDKEEDDENAKPILKLKPADPLVESLTNLGVPNSEPFVSGEGVSEKQNLATWRLLLGILRRARIPDKEEAQPEEDTLLSNPLVIMAREGSKGGQSTLLPRDLEQEIRQAAKKVAAPSKEKMEEILAMAAKEVERRKEKEAEEKGVEEKDLAGDTEKLSLCADDFGRFVSSFDSSHVRWIEKQEEGSSSRLASAPLDAEGSLSAAEAALASAEAHLVAQSALRTEAVEVRNKEKLMDVIVK